LGINQGKRDKGGEAKEADGKLHLEKRRMRLLASFMSVMDVMIGGRISIYA